MGADSFDPSEQARSPCCPGTSIFMKQGKLGQGKLPSAARSMASFTTFSWSIEKEHRFHHSSRPLAPPVNMPTTGRSKLSRCTRAIIEIGSSGLFVETRIDQGHVIDVFRVPGQFCAMSSFLGLNATMATVGMIRAAWAAHRTDPGSCRHLYEDGSVGRREPAQNLEIAIEGPPLIAIESIRS